MSVDRPVYTPEEETEGRAALAALQAVAARKDREAAKPLTHEQGAALAEHLRNATEKAERTGNLFADFLNRAGDATAERREYLTARTESDAALEAASAAVWELTR